MSELSNKVKFSDLCHFTDKQIEATKQADTHRYTLYGGSAGGGKILSNNGLILTPFGFKKGINLHVGDLVNNPDGTVQKIIQIKPEVRLPLWRVFFSDGTSTDVAEDHLWLAWKSKKSRKIGNKRISGESSSEVVETKTLKEWIEKGYKPQIPVCEEQSFNRTSKERNKINPYVLGVLLGDGCFTKNNLSISCSEEDKKHYLDILGTEDISQGKQDIRFIGYRKKQIKGKLSLHKLDGLGSKDKFIPDIYKYSSIEDRYSLIQGLMDTDGYKPKDKNGAYYYTISERLANDVAFILRSLGSVVTITEDIGKYKKDGKTIICNKVFNLYIKHRDTDSLFRLLRKKSNKEEHNISRAVIKVEQTKEIITGRCITVSNPNGLYITNDFIVTHNSYWLRWYTIRQLISWYKKTGIKGIRAGLFCEDYPALKDRHTSKIQYEFPEWLGSIKDSKENGLGFHIAPELGGGVMAMRNLDDPSKYLSSEFALIAIDELVMNQKEVFDMLRMRLRWTGIEDTKFIAATNPGGVGMAWVKKLWIDKEFEESEEEINEFIYVPARAYDNPYLADSYIKALSSLPEKMRKAYLDGDWNIFEGQFFSEFSKDKHVVEAFKIPSGWRKYRSIDIGGRNGITACSWFAVDYDGNVWNYKEYYSTGKDSDEHAKAIAEMSGDEEYHYSVIDNSAFSKIGYSETIAEVYQRCGITNLIPSNKDRISGWDFVHQYLRWDKDNEPKLKVFNNCREFIRTIPMLIHDKNKPEDVDSKGDDHIADEVRYFLQTLRSMGTPKPLNSVEQHLLNIKKLKESEISYILDNL